MKCPEVEIDICNCLNYQPETNKLPRQGLMSIQSSMIDITMTSSIDRQVLIAHPSLPPQSLLLYQIYSLALFIYVCVSPEVE